MWIIIGIFYAIVLSAGSTISGDMYDAPIPQRCATFEKAHDATNGNAAFCKAWFHDHETKAGRN